MALNMQSGNLIKVHKKVTSKMNPYNDILVSDNKYIREFNCSTTQEELVWHRDREDRIIESIGQTDWMIQFDNKLPQKIVGRILIKKGIYHRLIKGTGDLKIKLEKIYNI